MCLSFTWMLPLQTHTDRPASSQNRQLSQSAMASQRSALLPLALLAAAAFVATFGCSAFVSAPSQSALRGAMPAAGVAAAYGTLAAAVPEPAMAATEKELNSFGLFFAIFFLGFFLAGFARMFTVGKL